MSYTDGWAAIHLEMPDRVPRTEYSADTHWDLVSAVTGIDVLSSSDPATREKATNAFRKEWDYDFVWNILISPDEFGEKKSRMGHAKYASDGVDYDERIQSMLSNPEDALAFDPMEVYGIKEEDALIRRFNNDYKKGCIDYSDGVNMTGIYITCMSGLIEILGWDLLLTVAGIDSKGFGEMTGRYTDWIMQYFTALAKSDAPIVMVHDDIVWTEGAFLHPDWYREFIFPNYKKLFEPLIQAGKKIIYTSDGNYTEFLDDIVLCGANGFVMEPCTDMQHFADKYGKTHSFIGNADTRVLLYGSKEDIYNEVKRCMDIGKKYPGFFMAVGNHIPSNTPVENALYYNECYEKLSRR